MEQMKNKNTFLVACVSCIVLLLTFCYFGLNLSWKSTYSATTYSCLNGSNAVKLNGNYVCVTEGFTLNVSADMKSATCLFSSSSDITNSSSGISCGEGIIGANFSITYECNKRLTSVDNYCITNAIESSSTTESEYEYTIYYYANTGTGAPPDQTKTSKPSSLSITLSSTKPTRTGYTFTGWNTQIDGKGTTYDSGAVLDSTAPWIDNGTDAKAIGLYAQWELETPPSLTLTEKTGMIYNGSAQSANTATTNTGTAITYTYYTDSSCTTKTATSTGASAAGGAPVDAGKYYVKATSSGVSSSCVSHTISAKSVAVTWGVNTSFTYNGKAQGPTASVTTGINGESMTVSASTATVVGNYTSTVSCSSVTGGRAKCSNYTLTNTTKSFSIVAAEVKTYTVTYNANGTSVTGVPSAQTKNAGVTLTLSSTKPTRTGYTFTKWNTSADGSGISYDSGDSYKTDANLVLYAQWDINKYTISYDANGGANAPSNQTKEYGKNITLSSTKPTRTGYTFTKWNTSADGSGISYDSGASYTGNANLKLYAQWKEDTVIEEPETQVFKATFDENGGTLTGNKTATCSTTSSSCKITVLPTADKSGYTFTGWDTSSSCTSGNKSSLTLTKNTTYYACYTKNATTPPNSDNKPNVDTNPTTGDIAIALTWFVGLLAVGYSFYYFKSVKQN